MGNSSSSSPFVQIGTSSTRFFFDLTPHPNGVEVSYRVRAKFSEGEVVTFSGFSRTVTTTAVFP